MREVIITYRFTCDVCGAIEYTHVSASDIDSIPHGWSWSPKRGTGEYRCQKHQKKTPWKPYKFVIGKTPLIKRRSK